MIPLQIFEFMVKNGEGQRKGFFLKSSYGVTGAST